MPPISEQSRLKMVAAQRARREKEKTSPPDVQNVPDVFGLLERTRDAILQHNNLQAVVSDIRAALAQRDRFVLVPKWYGDLLAASPKPKVKCDECGRMVTAGDPHDCEDK